MTLQYFNLRDWMKQIFNQSEQYPDLGSDTSSVWNLCRIVDCFPRLTTVKMSRNLFQVHFWLLVEWNVIDPNRQYFQIWFYMLAVGLQQAHPPFFLQSSSVSKLKDGSRMHVFIVQKRSMECKTPFLLDYKKEQHRQYIQIIGLTLYSFLAKTRSVKRQLSIYKKTNIIKRTQQTGLM